MEEVVGVGEVVGDVGEGVGGEEAADGLDECGLFFFFT